ncbi:hypothetical protein VYU27_002127 [Nannochloropsis oceanica]
MAGARRAGMWGLVRVLESEEALNVLLSPETKEGASEKGKEEGRCDVVLVDALCSSSGVSRRHSSLRWTLKPEDALVTLPAIQHALLAQAQVHKKVGGRLVFATCSQLKEENEEVLAWFLEQYGDGGKEGGKEECFRALPWQGEEASLRAATQAWSDRNGGEERREELAPGTVQLLPHGAWNGWLLYGEVRKQLKHAYLGESREGGDSTTQKRDLNAPSQPCFPC